jgi:hypothetical protein
MLSWRLWKTLSEPAYKNPIFNRIRKEHSQQPKRTKPLVVPRYIHMIALLMMVLVFIRAPLLLVVVLQIPAFVVMGIVIIPLILPLIIVVIGGYLVSTIATNIHKEKQQYTYELLCAAPDGTLRANWLFATGLLHRGDWFQWVHAIGHITYRIGLVILLLFAGLTVLYMLSSDDGTQVESLRMLVNLTLLLGLYYSIMIQSFVLSLVVGLYATSLDLTHRDSSIIGLAFYTILQLIPYLIALTLFIVLQTLPNPHPAVTIGLDIIVLASIYVIHELSITLMWNQLAKRLNGTPHYAVPNGQVAPTHS